MSGRGKGGAGGRPLLVHMSSLGCPKNFVDTELAAASLVCEGFGLTSSPADADIEFINTCAFIQSARDEAESAIRAAERWKSKRPASRRIVVGGCLTEWDTKGEFKARHPSVDLWTRIDSASKLGQVLKGVGKEASGKGAEFLYNHCTPRLQLTPGHYAYIKIADGCDNHCSYCSIPSIRGALRSRTPDSVVEEARNLVSGGVKELILIAQDTAAFGRERGSGEGLAGLLRRLDGIEGEFWIRVMYLHPASVDGRLIESLASMRRLAPCVEMPLQHISDKVLKAMGRKIGSGATIRLLDRMRREIPSLAIRTTFLVGFPGEAEADFDVLRDFVKARRFERLGVFAYSRETGTPAAGMSAQVPEELASARRDELMLIQSGISLAANRALAGRTLDVIVDKVSPKGRGLGRSWMDAPDIDNSVGFSGAQGLHPGDFVKVKVKSASEYGLEGAVAGKSGKG